MSGRGCRHSIAVAVGVGKDVVAVPDAALTYGLLRHELMSCINHCLEPLHVFFGAYHTVLRTSVRVHRAVGVEVRTVTLSR